MRENMRIYIGGLGSNVQEDDLKKTFTSPQLGTVQSVEIIRSKGRSFGYLEFVPVSDKGLAKLFSTYNGCLWKGGRLKLEKAREDYLSCLRREWTKDAELEIKLSRQNVDANEIEHVLQKPKKDQDIHKLQFNIFFPKLRRIKPIPLKGTGKHKYSFQRVEIPPLPIHFCDCDEHSGRPESAKTNIADHHETRNIADHHETEAYGVNEDELNMMKLILNKFLEEENTSKTVPSEAELTEKINKDTTYAENLQVDDSEEEEASDEDNLVINIVGQPRKKVASFEDWGQKTTAANQDSLVREPEPFSRPITKIHGNNKEKLLPDMKRKQPIHENNNNIIPSKKKSKKGGPHDSADSTDAVNTRPTDTKSGSKQLSSDMPSSHKSAWRDLVIEKQNTAFHISDILADPIPDTEPKPRSYHLVPALRSNENVDPEDQSSQDKELSNLSDVQSIKPSASSEDKSGRGPSWLQKLSWLQLVGDTNKSAFNLSQILPGVTFEKQEAQQQFGGKNAFSNSRNGGVQQRFDCEDKNSRIEDIGKSQGGANKDIYATFGNKNVDVLTKEQNRAGLDGKRPNSDSKQTVDQEKVEVSANLLQNSRAVPEIVISETCPFMKSAASMKEWMKIKAALSGSYKKNGGGPGLK